MLENNFQNSAQQQFNIIQCNVHRNSFVIDGNINYISTQNEICMIYNAVFELNFSFSESLNSSYQNILVDSLPYILYGGNIIKKGFIHTFLKKLVGLEDFDSNSYILDAFYKNIKKDKLFGVELEILENTIFTDMNFALGLYTYFNYYEKTSYFNLFLKFIYQPYTYWVISRKDKETFNEINKVIGVSSRYEALDCIRKINEKIENFLIQVGGESYVNSINSTREINYLDLMIYAAYKAQVRVIKSTKRKKYKIDVIFHKNFAKIVDQIDIIILKKIKIINKFRIRSSEELNIPKFIFIDKSYQKYLDVPKETTEIKKRTLIRKTIISSFFIGLIILINFTHKK